MEREQITAAWQRLYNELVRQKDQKKPNLYIVSREETKIMKELNVEELRALIRLIPAVRALRDELEKSLHLELYGLGDMALKSYRGLQDSVQQVVNDPYVAALTPELPEGADDKQKVSMVLLVASQLQAYLEGQTGLAGITGGRQSYSVQTAPNISLNMGDMVGGEVERVMSIVNDALRGIPRAPKAPKPPKPPKPPKMPKHWRWDKDDDDDDDDDDESEA